MSLRGKNWIHLEKVFLVKSFLVCLVIGLRLTSRLTCKLISGLGESFLQGFLFASKFMLGPLGAVVVKLR